MTGAPIQELGKVLTPPRSQGPLARMALCSPLLRPHLPWIPELGARPAGPAGGLSPLSSLPQSSPASDRAAERALLQVWPKCREVTVPKVQMRCDVGSRPLLRYKAL